jgi:DUF917 family protein
MRLDDDRILRDLARGCGLLGAGGGGDTDLPLTMARYAVAEHGPVDVVDAADLPGDALVMPCGLIGSPMLATERIPSGDEGRVLRDAVQERRGEPIAALMPYSIGGANGLVCVAWAARLGLPVVDADAMGRTFPSLAQTTTGLAGIRSTPAILTDGRGNSVELGAADDAWAERLARRIATSLGGVCAAALACLSVADARRGANLGSVSAAAARGADPDGLGRVILDGRVGELERRHAADGIAVSLTLQAGGRRIRLEAQSEILLALEDGALCGAVPDVLALVDTATGAPVLVERVRQGQAVRLVLIEAPAIWGRPAGRALVDPAAFGLTLAPAPARAVQEVGDGAR